MRSARSQPLRSESAVICKAMGQPSVRFTRRATSSSASAAAPPRFSNACASSSVNLRSSMPISSSSSFAASTAWPSLG